MNFHSVGLILFNSPFIEEKYFYRFQYHSFLGHYALTVMVSVIATLAFESPVVAIEKLIFGKQNRVKTETNGDVIKPATEQPSAA